MEFVFERLKGKRLPMSQLEWHPGQITPPCALFSELVLRVAFIFQDADVVHRQISEYLPPGKFRMSVEDTVSSSL